VICEIAMPTFTEILPSQPSSPRNAINFTPASTPGAGVMTVHTARASVSYAVVALAPQLAGRAFYLAKFEGDVGTDAEADAYVVFCGRTSRECSCECRGFLRWSRQCKHIAACQALIENGWM
jgi:hypothetical protein